MRYEYVERLSSGMGHVWLWWFSRAVVLFNHWERRSLCLVLRLVGHAHL
jgi:hypothetical protein